VDAGFRELACVRVDESPVDKVEVVWCDETVLPKKVKLPSLAAVNECRDAVELLIEDGRACVALDKLLNEGKTRVGDK